MALSKKQLRIGVLGAANIARQFVAGVKSSRQVKVVAIGSRDLAKAQAFGQALSITTCYGSYDELLADASLDIVYNPLPNSLHAEWSIKALKAGHHVLCEKPLTLTLGEARQMFAAARASGKMLLEAYPWWFQPQTRDMLKLVHGGALGEVRFVQASFGFTMSKPDNNIRNNPALGGGALLDAGCYPLSLIQLVMGRAPKSVMAQPLWSPAGVDLRMTATLDYGDGCTAQLACAMDVAYHRHALIVGSKGVLETEFPNHHGLPLPGLMRVRRGTSNVLPLVPIESAQGSGFKFNADIFAQKIRQADYAALAQAENASLGIAATLEAIMQAARQGGGVMVPT